MPRPRPHGRIPSARLAGIFGGLAALLTGVVLVLLAVVAALAPA